MMWRVLIYDGEDNTEYLHLEQDEKPTKNQIIAFWQWLHQSIDAKEIIRGFNDGRIEFEIEELSLWTANDFADAVIEGRKLLGLQAAQYLTRKG